MSIDISWNNLTTGPDGQALADQIRDFIHEKFQQVQLPRFIRSVGIHAFSFGEECPSIEIKDITDPLDDFYDDSEDGESGDEEEEEEEAALGEVEARVAQPEQPMSQKPTHLPPHIRPAEGLNNPLLSPFPRTPTPGIPGGTSNLGSYFHLPLSGLSGAATPITPFAAPWPQYHHHNRPPSPPRTIHQLNPDEHPDPSSPPRVPKSPHPAQAATAQTLPGPHTDPSAESRAGDPLDIQLTLHISYTGSLSLSLTAEILLDYPMPSFVGIPLKLQISGLSFDGVGLLAYLRGKKGQEGERTEGKIKFAFVAPEDARVLVGDAGSWDGKEGRGDEGKGGEDKRKGGFGRLLEEIHVESEIGRQEGGKQVLKNVGKVERFVLEQVRRIFEEEFVWPSSWTFLV